LFSLADCICNRAKEEPSRAVVVISPVQTMYEHENAFTSRRRRQTPHAHTSSKLKPQTLKPVVHSRENSKSLCRSPLEETIPHQKLRQVAVAKGILNQQDDIDLMFTHEALNDPIQRFLMDIPEQEC